MRAKSWKTFDQFTYLNISSFKKILLLSDAGRGALELESRKTSEQLLISTDINQKPGVNLIADNNKLPFRENSFDFIYLNRGLCPCRGAIACGGINTQRDSMTSFLNSIIHMLDKKNPNSLAILTGFYFPGLFGKTVPTLWRTVVDEMQAANPQLQIGLLTADGMSNTVEYGFIGVVISTDRTKPNSQRINELYPMPVMHPDTQLFF
ncbi:MAG: hypothetical protein H7061_10135 [Bdellovibrionaceae bacterium]|nr:hypothetical protein [Bdellovibrio sp.]